MQSSGAMLHTFAPRRCNNQRYLNRIDIPFCPSRNQVTANEIFSLGKFSVTINGFGWNFLQNKDPWRIRKHVPDSYTMVLICANDYCYPMERTWLKLLRFQVIDKISIIFYGNFSCLVFLSLIEAVSWCVIGQIFAHKKCQNHESNQHSHTHTHTYTQTQTHTHTRTHY